MPDISMCENLFCPLKHICYRYTATPSNTQSYAEFSYTHQGMEDGCDYFIANDSTGESNG